VRLDGTTPNAVTEIGGNPLNDGADEVRNFTIDTAVPTADVVDVTPDPRTDAVGSIAIFFSEAAYGLDLADLTLTRDGGANLLTGGETLSTADNVTWTLGNLSGITQTAGTYLLTLAAAGWGITDLAGNALAADASDTWLVNAASISGYVWNDPNGNGWDQGEAMLSGWTLYLDGNGNGILDSGERSTVSASNGYYVFGDLTPGLYIVREVVQSGWRQTYPSDNRPYVLTPSAGQSVLYQSFGNREVTAVTLPYTQDFSTGKPAMGQGWEYYSTGEGRIEVVGGKLRMDDSVKGSQYSLNEAILHLNLAGQSNVQLGLDHQTFGDETHRYSQSQFAGHVNADLIAVSVNGANWVKVTDLTTSFTAKSFALDTLLQQAGQAAGSTDRSDVRIKFQQYDNDPWGSASWSSDGRAFDNIRVTALSGTASISGYVWNDPNANGWDPGETMLLGWTVYLDNNGNGVLDSGERSTLSASNGYYAFADLTPGTYTVREVVQSGWRQTYPSADRPYVLTLSAGQSVLYQSFGNQQVGLAGGASFVRSLASPNDLARGSSLLSKTPVRQRALTDAAFAALVGGEDWLN